VQRVLQQMAQQSGMCLYQDRFTSKWLAFVWKPGAAADFRRPLKWDDLASFSWDRTSVVDVRHAIRVKYGFDHFKSKTLFETFVNADGSGQGFTQPTVRDQRLVISASNNKIDWVKGASTFAATLASGTYAPIDLADEARTKMRTAEGDNSKFFGYGHTIKAGYNDLLDFNVGATPFQAILVPGDYPAEGLAAEATRAMNAVLGTGRVFSVVYAHSTNKYTTSASGGTFSLPGLATAAGILRSTLPVLGYNFTIGGSGAVSSSTGANARYSNRFWYGDGDFSGGGGVPDTYKWLTGANAATNCADVVGVLRVDVNPASRDVLATFSRGDRERVADTYQTNYGPKEERQITLDWVRDETTAVEFRNRLFDLTATPRVVVRFSSFRVPDLRVMQVISFDADLDQHLSYPKYGSDGSWAGKAFRVLEVEQGTGPLYATTVLAMEA
jgi:hypothetical protein